MSLIELAERVEAAEGPDRELDALIYAWKASQREYVIDAYPAPNAKGRIVCLYDTGTHSSPSAPRYTASIDAAVTLVPEGLILRQYMVSRFVPHSCEVAVSYGHGGWVGNSDHSFALALCAAALRARDTYAKRQDRHGLGPKDSGPVGEADAPKGGSHDPHP